MTAIEDYKNAKQSLKDATEWAALLGKKYSGGGGGVGKFAPAKTSVHLCIYHQPRDGDNNYHDMPKCLEPDMQSVLTDTARSLIELAIVRMEAKCQALAALAAKEYAELLQESGIDLDKPQAVPENRDVGEVTARL